MTRFGNLRAANQQVGNVGAGVDKTVGCGATEPLRREGLVQEEGCHVLVVGERLVCAVGQGTEDEYALSCGDGQPAQTSVDCDRRLELHTSLGPRGG